MAIVFYRDENLPLTAEVIDGRPDIGPNRDPRFGVTRAKAGPAYVYSARGSLVHEVARVELHWWAVTHGGHKLTRLASPVPIAHTRCNMSYRLPRGWGRDRPNGIACAVPAPGAVLCRACQARGRNFT